MNSSLTSVTAGAVGKRRSKYLLLSMVAVLCLLSVILSVIFLLPKARAMPKEQARISFHIGNEVVGAPGDEILPTMIHTSDNSLKETSDNDPQAPSPVPLVVYPIDYTILVRFWLERQDDRVYQIDSVVEDGPDRGEAFQDVLEPPTVIAKLQRNAPGTVRYVATSIYGVILTFTIRFVKILFRPDRIMQVRPLTSTQYSTQIVSDNHRFHLSDTETGRVALLQGDDVSLRETLGLSVSVDATQVPSLLDTQTPSLIPAEKWKPWFRITRTHDLEVSADDLSGVLHVNTDSTVLDRPEAWYVFRIRYHWKNVLVNPDLASYVGINLFRWTAPDVTLPLPLTFLAVNGPDTDDDEERRIDYSASQLSFPIIDEHRVVVDTERYVSNNENHEVPTFGLRYDHRSSDRLFPGYFQSQFGFTLNPEHPSNRVTLYSPPVVGLTSVWCPSRFSTVSKAVGSTDSPLYESDRFVDHLTMDPQYNPYHWNSDTVSWRVRHGGIHYISEVILSYGSDDTSWRSLLQESRRQEAFNVCTIPVDFLSQRQWIPYATRENGQEEQVMDATLLSSEQHCRLRLLVPTHHFPLSTQWSVNVTPSTSEQWDIFRSPQVVALSDTVNTSPTEPRHVKVIDHMTFELQRFVDAISTRDLQAPESYTDITIHTAGLVHPSNGPFVYFPRGCLQHPSSSNTLLEASVYELRWYAITELVTEPPPVFTLPIFLRILPLRVRLT